nr:hypothetical protein [Variovorax paradoxus]
MASCAFGASAVVALTTVIPEFISASRTHRRSRFALTPWAIATAAIDMPGCMQLATAFALNSSL